MNMKNFVLHGNILLLEVRLNEEDYVMNVKWNSPVEQFCDTWSLVSYCKKTTGEKDLSPNEINDFLKTINANWKWEPGFHKDF